MNIFTDIALSIDRTIYTWIPYIYNLIIKLASYEVFDPGDISGLSRRIYALLGIFMLFKLTFSMISYIVNPDEFSDKSKGFSGLIKNVIISMVLIVAVPYIFAEAFYVQKMILEDGTLVKLIFSKGNDTTTDRSDIAYATRGAGEQISFVIFSQFVKPNDDIAEISENCTTIYELDESGNIIKDGDYSYKVNEECFDNTLKGLFDNDSAYTHYKDAMAYQDFNLLINDENIFSAKQKKEIVVRKSNGTIKKEYDKIRIIKYNWILSFIFGWVILSFLITLCIDVATRTIKLAFFQIIAPIPIISNCDPKAKKDGMFQKWVKACVSTYLDLFIRLIMFFLAIYIIKSFSVKFFSTNNGALTLFIVVGALVFAKQAPKIVEDLTGLKIEKFTLNPFKKVANEALLPDKVGKAIGKIGLGGLMGLGFGTGKTLAMKLSAGRDAYKHDKGFWNGFGSVHGKIGTSIDKFRQNWTPYAHADSKAVKEAKETTRKDEAKRAIGSKYYKNGKMLSDEFAKDLKATNVDYYNSWKDTDKKKVAMYQAQARNETWKQALFNHTVTEQQRQDLIASLHLDPDADDSKIVQMLDKNSNTYKKQYEEALRKHNNMAKLNKYSDAAKLQESFDYYKDTYEGLSEIEPYRSSDYENSTVTRPSTVGGSTTTSNSSSNTTSSSGSSNASGGGSQTSSSSSNSNSNSESSNNNQQIINNLQDRNILLRKESELLSEISDKEEQAKKLRIDLSNASNSKDREEINEKLRKLINDIEDLNNQLSEIEKKLGNN